MFLSLFSFPFSTNNSRLTLARPIVKAKVVSFPTQSISFTHKLQHAQLRAGVPFFVYLKSGI